MYNVSALEMTSAILTARKINAVNCSPLELHLGLHQQTGIEKCKSPEIKSLIIH